MSDYTNTGKKAYPPRGKMLTIPEGGKPGQVLMRTVVGLEWADLPIAGLSSYGTVKAANYVYDTEEETPTNFENLIDAMKAAGMIDAVE